MKEQLISFKTAKLAKEKGFDIPTNRWYYDTGKLEKNCSDKRILDWNNYEYTPNRITATTQSVLQRWLREETLVEVFVEKYVHRYRVKAINYDGDLTNSYTDHFTIYEKALEMGLKKALKLITKTKKP